jgi:hypothetical protein
LVSVISNEAPAKSASDCQHPRESKRNPGSTATGFFARTSNGFNSEHI